MVHDVSLIDLNPNTEVSDSQNIYSQSQRRSRDVALKRAFGVYVAAVDTSKREKKKKEYEWEMSVQIKMFSVSSVIID